MRLNPEFKLQEYLGQLSKEGDFMKGFNIKVVLLTLLNMVILYLISEDILWTLIISFVMTMIEISIFYFLFMVRASRMLDEKCDPSYYIEANEKMKKVIKKKGSLATYIYDLNRSAGLIALGKLEEAKELLEQIDPSDQMNSQFVRIIHTMHLFTCHCELGEIEEAEVLYQKEFQSIPVLNKKLNMAIEYTSAERLFFHGQFVESKIKFNQLLQKKISLRNRLTIIYKLAQVDEVLGDFESALSKYKEVSEKGNQLWIAKEAKKRIL